MPLSTRSPLSMRVLGCAAVATLAVAAMGLAEDAVKQTPFTTVMLGHFAAWDADHDGAISPAEIDKLLVDPSVHGDDAAAVSALKLITRADLKIKADDEKKLPPLTVAYFEKYNQKAVTLVKKEVGGDVLGAATATEGGARDASGNGEPTTKPVDSPVKWDRAFAAGQKRLTIAGGSQFTSAAYSIDGMKQGALGDCFFVASLGAVVTRRPETVKQLVTLQSDGSYRANFPGLAPFSVPKLTDSQIAISGTSGNGALLAVFEQAFGKYRGQLSGKGIDVDGTDMLYKGGDSGQTLPQLTGHAVHRISFGKTLEARREDAAKVLPEVRELLVSNIKNDLAITGGGVIGVKRKKDSVGTEIKTDKGTLPLVPPAILQNHVYVIVAFDPKTDLVTIWNPHGNTFKPKGTPGLENGYVTEGGKFTLPLSEAYQFYGSFTFETDKPFVATKKGDVAAM